jgi:hypothetical protein
MRCWRKAVRVARPTGYALRSTNREFGIPTRVPKLLLRLKSASAYSVELSSLMPSRPQPTATTGRLLAQGHEKIGHPLRYPRRELVRIRGGSQATGRRSRPLNQEETKLSKLLAKEDGAGDKKAE